MLRVDIRKQLGGFTLDVAFDADVGTLALLGASGCGKSVTLRCIAGIMRPDEGQITLSGRVLYDSAAGICLPPQQRRIGYLFQHYSLFPNMTVAQNIAQGARKLPFAQRRKTVLEMLKALRLTEHANHRPNQLSGGQRQRTALARILVNKPDALLLDEPFSALDDYLKWQVELELAEMLKAFGGTTVLVSHDRGEVYRLSDSVCVVANGKSEVPQEVHELFAAPRSRAAALISGCKNYSRVTVNSDGSVFAADWNARLKPSSPVSPETEYIGVRAHYLKPSATPGENTIECEVLSVIEDVFSVIVMALPRGASSQNEYSRMRVELSKEQWKELGNPDTVYLKVEPQDIILLN